MLSSLSPIPYLPSSSYFQPPYPTASNIFSSITSFTFLSSSFFISITSLTSFSSSFLFKLFKLITSTSHNIITSPAIITLLMILTIILSLYLKYYYIIKFTSLSPKKPPAKSINNGNGIINSNNTYHTPMKTFNNHNLPLTANSPRLLSKDGTPLLQGYLYKKSSHMLKGWQRRFFLVNGNTLQYFESKESAENYNTVKNGYGNTIEGSDKVIVSSDFPQSPLQTSAQVLSIIDIRSFQTLTMEHQVLNFTVFKTVRLYRLRCGSVEECAIWFNKLSAIRKNSKRPSFASDNSTSNVLTSRGSASGLEIEKGKESTINECCSSENNKEGRKISNNFIFDNALSESFDELINAPLSPPLLSPTSSQTSAQILFDSEILPSLTATEVSSLVHLCNIFKSPPQTLLLRFLRSANGDICKAETLLSSHLQWRSSTFPIHYTEVRKELSIGRFIIRGVDLDGDLVLYVNGSIPESTSVNNNDEGLKKHTRAVIYLMEAVSDSCLTPLKKITIVYKRVKVNKINLTWAAAVSSVLQANYPDKIKQILVLPTSHRVRSLWWVSCRIGVGWGFWGSVSKRVKVAMLDGIEGLEKYIHKDEMCDLINADGLLMEGSDVGGGDWRGRRFEECKRRGSGRDRFINGRGGGGSGRESEKGWKEKEQGVYEF